VGGQPINPNKNRVDVAPIPLVGAELCHFVHFSFFFNFFKEGKGKGRNTEGKSCCQEKHNSAKKRLTGEK
jgi:hypothetical protein